jgi:hypothetical protein
LNPGVPAWTFKLEEEALMAGKLVVFAIYSTARNVEHAINSLISANINAADISVWFSRSLTSREFVGGASYESRPSVEAYLKNMGIPIWEVDRYENVIQKGGILLAVRCSTPEESDRARHIMKGSHGGDVSSTSKYCANSTDASQ